MSDVTYFRVGVDPNQDVFWPTYQRRGFWSRLLWFARQMPRVMRDEWEHARWVLR